MMCVCARMFCFSSANDLTAICGLWQSEGTHATQANVVLCTPMV